MLPALKALEGHTGVPFSRVCKRIAAAEGVTACELEETLLNGERTFVHRVRSAVFYLAHARLVEPTYRGRWRLTKEGQKVLADPPRRIDRKYLERYPAVQAWRRSQSSGSFNSEAESSLWNALTDTPQDKRLPGFVIVFLILVAMPIVAVALLSLIIGFFFALVHSPILTLIGLFLLFVFCLGKIIDNVRSKERRRFGK